MKKIIYLLPLLIAGCAPPKYSYYFDRVETTTAAEVAEVQQVRAEDPILLASIEREPSEFRENHGGTTIAENNLVNTTLTRKEVRQERKKIRRETISLIKELRSARNDDSVRSVKADASRNGFAIAGFVSSLVGLFVLWPLCILGIIFSAIGMKSEKKGLATAGLIIGIVGVVLILIAGAIIASSF